MNAPRRVAVLGGGVSALAAVWDLVQHDPDVEVTIYQMGWRLGGKCASGRNADIAQRIEEHGLHILFGFYENAFHMFRAVFDELNAPPGSPLAKWTDAFEGKDCLTLAEKVGDDWVVWPLKLPDLAGIPGDRAKSGEPGTYTDLAKIAIAYARGVVDYVEHSIRDDPLGERIVIKLLLEGLELVVEHMSKQVAEALEAAANLIGKILPKLWRDMENIIERDTRYRRDWIMIELGLTIAKGLISEYTSGQTRDELDAMNLIDWLDKHSPVPGGLSRLTRESAPLNMLHDLVFAYDEGDMNRPLLAAGTAVIGAANILFNYRGHLFYQMKGGTGDVLAGPIYQVLRSEKYNRRVRFEFFHEVQKLELNDRRDAIRSIQLKVQATPKSAPYEPLVMVKNVPCWPNAPLYDLLEQGELLKAGDELPGGKGFDLESPWTAWPGVGMPVTLEQGRDFDDVVLAIPVAALADITRDLCADQLTADASDTARTAADAWSKMLKNLSTVATQSFQLWANQSVDQMGGERWKQNGAIVHGSFVGPHSNWADWSDLVSTREQWPEVQEPSCLALICDVLHTPAGALPPDDGPAYEKQMDQLVHEQMLNFVEEPLRSLWPKAYQDGAFRFDLLTDLQDGKGQSRLGAQYWRANVVPWERYTTSYPGSGAFRLRPDQSGFKHLYLAGDWTRNGLDFGAVEASVMSGRLAARGLLGQDYVIYGAGDDGAG